MAKTLTSMPKTWRCRCYIFILYVGLPLPTTKLPHTNDLELSLDDYHIPTIGTQLGPQLAWTSAGAHNLCNTTTTHYQTTTYQLSELSLDLSWGSKSTQDQWQIIEDLYTIIENQCKIIDKSLKTNIKSLKIYRKSMKIYAESMKTILCPNHWKSIQNQWQIIENQYKIIEDL